MTRTLFSITLRTLLAISFLTGLLPQPALAASSAAGVAGQPHTGRNTGVGALAEAQPPTLPASTSLRQRSVINSLATTHNRLSPASAGSLAYTLNLAQKGLLDERVSAVPSFLPALTSAVIDPLTGGVVTLVGANSTLTLTFPPDAVTEDVEVTIEEVSNAADLPDNAIGLGLAYTLTAEKVSDNSPVVHFARPFEASLLYNPAALNGTDEDRLLLATTLDTGLAYRSLPTDVNQGMDTAEASTSHFSNLALIAQADLATPAPTVLTPPSDPTPSGLSLPEVVFTDTVTVDYTDGTTIILSSTPDGEGELLTDDEVNITVTNSGGTFTYSHDYFDLTENAYLPTDSVDLTALFRPGANTVTIEIIDSRPGITWTQGYMLVQPRNPYSAVLGGEMPTIMSGGIDLASGNYLRTETDITAPAPGLGVSFTRTYNSFDPTSGVFGFGWSSPYDSRATVYADGSVEIKMPSGRRALFTPDGSGGFTPEAGIFDTLTAAGGGYVLTQKTTLIKFHFDSSGRLTQLTEPNGNAVTIAYSGNSPVSLTDPAGRVYAFTTDGAGRITQITDPAGNLLFYFYNAAGDLEKVIDRRNGEWEYTYDSAHRLLTLIDPDNKTIVSNTYSADGRLLTSTDGANQTWTATVLPDGRTRFTDQQGDVVMIVTYDDRFRVVAVEDADGNIVRYTYNDQNLLTSITDTLNGVDRTTTFVYDANGNLTDITDPAGNTTHIDLTSLDRPDELVDALGNITDYSYDANGNLTNIDIINNVDSAVVLSISLTYDAQGKITHIENGAGEFIDYTYDAEGNLESATNALGETETYTYDELGRLISRTDARTDGTFTTTYTYDAEGNLTSITHPENDSDLREYDGQGRMTSYTNALGDTWTWKYDGNGKVIEETDPEGGKRTSTYDERGNLTRVTVANSVSGSGDQTTTYTYNALNYLETITDAEGGITRVEHDALGRVIKVTDPRGKVWELKYDSLDRVIERMDPLLNKVKYGYDDVGNLTSVTVVNGAPGSGDQTTSYTYDGARNLTTLTDALNGVTKYDYDPAGHITKITNPRLAETKYTYDTAGRLTKVEDALHQFTEQTYTAAGDIQTVKDREGRITEFTYDGNRRLKTLKDALNGIQRFNYDAAGNLTTYTDANLHTTDFEYDKVYRTLKVTDALNNATDYQYDQVGNLIEVIAPPTGNPLLPASTKYTYDKLNRLTTVKDALDHLTTYGYDPNSNLTSLIDPLNRTTEFEYDDRNLNTKLIAPPAAVGAPRGETVFTYDPAGNLLRATDAEGRTTNFEYDKLNRSTKIIDALSGETALGYDPVGNLISILEPAVGAQPRALTAMQYDLLDRLEKVTNALGEETNYQYDNVGNLTRIIDALNFTTDIQYDALNRPEDVTEAFGTVDARIHHFDYDPVGSLLAHTDPRLNTTNFQYDAVNRLTKIINPPAMVGNPAGEAEFTYDARGSLLSVTDANNHATSYTYDLLRRRTSQTDARNRVTTYQYDPVSNLTKVIDPRLGEYKFAYDDLDRLIGASKPIDATTDATTLYGYDLVGNLLTTTNANGRTTNFAYDELNRLTTITDALENDRTFAYDAVSNLIQSTDELDNVTEYKYDPLHRVTEIIDPLLGHSLFSYDEVGNLESTTNPNNALTSYGYDGLRRLKTLTDPVIAGGQSGATAFEYDPNDNLTKVTDPNGNDTELEYDALNRRTRLIDPLGNDATWDYDLVGNLTRRTDKRNNPWSMAYDEVNNLTRVTDPLNGQTSFTYDANDNLQTVTDANLHTTAFAYDLANRLTTITDALNGVTAFEYDLNDNLKTYTDANTHATSYLYDELDRRVQMTDPVAAITTYAYDPRSLLTGVTDANNHTTTYGYDALQRLTQVTDPLNGETEYGYDLVGNLTSQTDANDHTTTFGYDLLNRLTSEADPLNNTWRYEYDPASNLKKRTDANGQVTNYLYDSLNRRTKTDYPDPSAGSGQASDITYGYDADSNLTNIANPAANITATYDSLNRITSLTTQNSELSTFNYTYDPVGNLLQTKYPNNQVVNYSYDELNRQKSMTDPLGNTTSYAYDPVGNLKQTSYPNGINTFFTYDAADRLTDVQSRKGTSLLQQNALTRDGVGNVLTMAERFPQGNSTRTINHTYNYDSLDRLLSDAADATWPSGNDVTRSYTYDPVGNRLSESVTTSSTQTTNYSYDAANRLTSSTQNSALSTFNYDANGNRTQATSPSLTEKYTYNFEDQLASYTKLIPQKNGKFRTDLTANYSYDGLGRRTQKSLQDNGQPKVTNYLYDRFTYDPLQETASPGNKVTHLYRGAGYLTETRDMQGNGNGSTYYRQPNWRGDVALITNQSGGSVHDYLYTAYGQLLDNNNNLQDSSNFTGPHNHYTLTGKELDTESGLVYFGARYYSSTTGSWLTQDPVRGSLTDPLQHNRYLFNRANPVRLVDPLGLEWIDACNNPADMSCWYARHYAEGITKPKEQQQQQATNTQVVLYQPLTNGDGGGGDNGGGDGGGGGIGGESYWGDYYVEPPRVPPPPLSNAIALCNSIYAPPQLSGWCANVEQGVVAPLPPNLYSQIMSSGFAQYAYGLMMEPEQPKLQKPLLSTQDFCINARCRLGGQLYRFSSQDTNTFSVTTPSKALETCTKLYNCDISHLTDLPVFNDTLDAIYGNSWLGRTQKTLLRNEIDFLIGFGVEPITSTLGFAQYLQDHPVEFFRGLNQSLMEWSSSKPGEFERKAIFQIIEQRYIADMANHRGLVAGRLTMDIASIVIPMYAEYRLAQLSAQAANLAKAASVENAVTTRLVGTYTSDIVSLKNIGNEVTLRPGFTQIESNYINRALSGQISPEEAKWVSCHRASMCSSTGDFGWNMISENDSLLADPSFKVQGQLGSDVPIKDLQPGDLVTYYDLSEYKNYPVHSDRVLTGGDSPIMFDKAGQGLSKPFTETPLEEILNKWAPDYALVYRR